MHSAPTRRSSLSEARASMLQGPLVQGRVDDGGMMVRFSLCFFVCGAVSACQPKASVSPKAAPPEPQQAATEAPPQKPDPIDESAKPQVVDEANRLAQAGDFEAALELLEEHLASNSDDRRARLTLGWILDYDGRPEEAIETWEKGITGNEDDYPLWMSIGEVRTRQASDGPTATRRRGTITYHPGSDDEKARHRFEQEHLRMAAHAYSGALAAHPSPRAVAALASVYARLGQHEDAAAAWHSLAKDYPSDIEVWLGLADAEKNAGNLAQAQSAATSALAVNPRSAPAHRLLAEVREADGRTEEATSSRRRAEFFAWMAPFTTAVFTEERYAIVSLIAGRARGEDKETREARAKQRAQTIRDMLLEDSPFSSDFLASLAWHHEDHGELEVAAYAALEKRAAHDALLSLLKTARSTCTQRSAGHAVARLQTPGALDALVELLPGDVRAFMHGDLAGALTTLKDPAAVPHLLGVLSPDLPAAAEGPDDRMHVAAGRNEARKRAAVALGAYDTPEARQGLQRCLDNPDFSVHCHAALFAITRDQRHLDPVATLLRSEAGKFEHEIADLLKGIVDPAAQRAIEQWTGR